MPTLAEMLRQGSFENPNNPYSSSLLSDALRGSLSNAESLGRGAAVAPLGIFGDVNALAREYVTPRLPAKVQAALESLPAAPTTEAILANIPRGTEARRESSGMEQLGVAMNPAGPVEAAKGITKGLGAYGKLADSATAFIYPQEEALRLAQQRAALPIKQGGLGLSASNTPAERAKAMGFDIESLHGTSNPNIEKFDPSLVGTKAGNAFDNYIWSTTSPDAATGYSLNMKSYETLPEVVKLKEQKNDILKQISKSFEEKDSEKVGELRKQLNSIAEKESTIYDTFKKGEILSEGSTVYPLTLQRQEFMPYEAGGKNWKRANLPAIEKSKELGYQGAQINNVVDNPNSFMGNEPATTFATENPDLLRSRFAAFDPWRKTAAVAGIYGVAAPDLLAKERK